MSRPRILLADDSAAMREVLRNLLQDEFLIVASVADGQSAVKASAELNPDIVLLDISMPNLNGIEAARQIRGLRESILLVFVTQHREQSYVDEAFRAGAVGYVIKQRAASDLPIAMHEVLAHREYGRTRFI